MIILASQSPRRKELLSLITDDFIVCPAEGEENKDSFIDPSDLVMSLSQQKALEVGKKYNDDVIIGADTIVVCEGQVLGKPKNPDDSRRMLRLLSGRTHGVYTGTSIYKSGKIYSFYQKTDVTFYNLTDEEIEWYISTGEPSDKAGAYGIQGYGALLIKEINGDFYTVMGLSVGKLKRELEKIIDL